MKQACYHYTTGKYIDIYFNLKITYPISTLPEHLHSTIPNIIRMVGCAINTNNIGKTGNSDTSNTNSPWEKMPKPWPRRSVAKNVQVMCHGQGGLNERPFDGTS